MFTFLHILSKLKSKPNALSNQFQFALQATCVNLSVNFPNYNSLYKSRPASEDSIGSILKMKLLLSILFLTVAAAQNFTDELEPQPEPVQDLDDLDDELPNNIITNGYTAAEGEAPYIVYLSFSNSWCGGSIIGNTWVVTASHCTKPHNSVTIYYGSLRRGQSTVRHTVSGSNNIINHPSDDIALIRTPHVNFNNQINRIRLPSLNTNNQYVNQASKACGWGLTASGKAADALQCVNLQVISNDQCRRSYAANIIKNQILCVSTPNGRSICSGDSGGPLVSQSNPVLIGVSNFVSSRGCKAGQPAGFARVTSHLNWIRQQTGISY